MKDYIVKGDFSGKDNTPRKAPILSPSKLNSVKIVIHFDNLSGATYHLIDR